MKMDRITKKVRSEYNQKKAKIKGVVGGTEKLWEKSEGWQRRERKKCYGYKKNRNLHQTSENVESDEKKNLSKR